MTQEEAVHAIVHHAFALLVAAKTGGQPWCSLHELRVKMSELPDFVAVCKARPNADDLLRAVERLVELGVADQQGGWHGVGTYLVCARDGVRLTGREDE
mgnify:CR=1 FL=1